MQITTMASSLLELHNITLSFKGIKALNELSFTVSAGEICALIGPNGAGKSSLLNVLGGIYRPDAGEIRFDGKTLLRARPMEVARHGIGRTFQHANLFKRMSVIDNVMTGLSRHNRVGFLSHALRLGASRRAAAAFHARAEEVLRFLELQAWRDTIVDTLPYGVQKRVDLARALVSTPRLLLLDEPLAGMNRKEKTEMRHFIADVNRELGVTVVLIEHDMPVVMGLAQHVVVLDYGRKVGDGTPREVRSNPEVIAAYLGTKH